ncbi:MULTISPECIES: MotA/TolQ/ExbB proton channel family protein [Hydrocarboniphaga]|jgi:biopolymer transport protein ExbB|uniref:Biopolymer transport protein ExbB n=1 Tax=Hydrocarboniphaga effusa AP103 TaxID=1172194 RepID=I8T5T7_9GAMM|nr:MotA/TolQ/ExbB proton channel family protein [Hydrocarboniphaga sp.]EIT69310.1 biopolymer transport protein [Hydrocarboniphaga effusa AP103]MDZ4080697.1 MotA/TolQ/ExbB proton channel family protein [Hydrocarboniphaga sp.]
MEPQSLGIQHFLGQSDAVSKFLLIVLVLMSVASWYLIVSKSIRLALERRRSERFLNFFWNAKDLTEVQEAVVKHHADEPFSHLSHHAIFAREHHARFGASRLEEAGSAAEFLTRTIRKVIDEETAKMESGLTVLASVGSTAPFVGLFGTVWGIYHALLAIGMSGSGSLDKVAGPVGEALIMTAIGLGVAIPAVLGYNFLVRSNRMVLARLDTFAHDLYAFLTTGAQFVAAPPVRVVKSTAGN